MPDGPLEPWLLPCGAREREIVPSSCLRTAPSWAIVRLLPLGLVLLLALVLVTRHSLVQGDEVVRADVAKFPGVVFKIRLLGVIEFFSLNDKSSVIGFAPARLSL